METLLQRVRSIYLSLSATTYGRVTRHVDHCPHCHERTTWAVRILTGYARCLQCERNPLDRDDQTPMNQGSRETSAPSRASVPV
jgi:hypothetical protein